MERFLKIFNVVVMVVMVVIVCDYFNPFMSFSRAIIGDIAIQMEDGGIMSAAGFWHPPVDPILEFVSRPISLMILVLGFVLSYSLFFEKYPWDFLVSTHVSVLLCVVLVSMAICVVRRYDAWHAAGFH